MGGKKKYIEMIGSFTEPFICVTRSVRQYTAQQMLSYTNNTNYQTTKYHGIKNSICSLKYNISIQSHTRLNENTYSSAKLITTRGHSDMAGGALLTCHPRSQRYRLTLSTSSAWNISKWFVCDLQFLC